MTKPAAKPANLPKNPNFSSGPCAKRPGWSLDALKDAPLGRSHRAKIGKAKLKLSIDLTREILQVPADYRIGIVPASDTGAVEMAMWSLLGPRGVDALAWESFGEGWVTDIVKQLKLKDARVLKAPYGEIVDLASVNFDNDVIFTWNGTTSGVRVPNGDWIPADRKGLTIADATSAAFAQKLDWAKLDVVTFSWHTSGCIPSASAAVNFKNPISSRTVTNPYLVSRTPSVSSLGCKFADRTHAAINGSTLEIMGPLPFE